MSEREARDVVVRLDGQAALDRLDERLRHENCASIAAIERKEGARWDGEQFVPWEKAMTETKRGDTGRENVSVAAGAAPMDDAAGMALIEAVQTWAADCEGQPGDPSDARLLKALWTYEGGHTTPCPECDGECGEPCAPCTVEQAHAALDRFIEKWLERHGLREVPPS